MNNFLTDFSSFMHIFLEELISVFNWFMSTLIGEIIVFTIIILIFVALLKRIIHLKD